MNKAEALAVLRRARELEAENEPEVLGWYPWEPTEKQALLIDTVINKGAKEVFFGGSAGGAKSVGLLMLAAEIAKEPGKSILILRRTLAALEQPDSIMDLSLQWWLGRPGFEWSAKKHQWTLPSGSRIKFGYLDHVKHLDNYQGAQFTMVGVDELTQFDKYLITYLFSRMRQPKGGRTVMVNTGNPGGVGHDWVYERYIENPGDRVFIPSSLFDNPHLDHEDYVKNMGELDELRRRQLLHGEWVKESEGLIFYAFNRADNTVDEIPKGDWTYALGVDLGTSENEPTTAYCVAGFIKNNPTAYILECFKEAGEDPSSVAEKIEELQRRYGRFVHIVMDQGGLGGGYIKYANRRHGLGVEPVVKGNKNGYRRIINGAFERKELYLYTPQVYVEPGSPGFNGTEELIQEMLNGRWNRKGTDIMEGQPDHAMDAAVYVYEKMYHYFEEAKKVAPAPGSEAHFEKVANELRERRLRSTQRQEKTPWFAR